MRWIGVLALCAGIGGAGACGPVSKPAATTPPPAPAPTLADEVDAMCACKSQACADKVHADFAEVDRALTAQYPAGGAAPPAHVAALRAYAGTCEEAAPDGEDQTTIDAMRDAMCKCKTVACTDEVQAHYAGWMKGMNKKYRGKRRPSDKLMESGMAMAKCMDAARRADPGGGDLGIERGSVDDKDDAKDNKDEASGVAGAGVTGVAECDAYLAAFDRYMQCDKVPQQAKDASRSGIRQMKEGWAMLRDPDVPAEAKKAAADACKQATDALKQSARAMGCPL
jgi:hypothetical protein